MRAVLFMSLSIATVGCRLDMHDQPRYEPYESSEFLPDESAALTPVPGTVARGQLREDPLLYTGMLDGKQAEVFPFDITRADLERGRERYDIYCSVCHDRAGTGQGMIVRRGMKQPASFHESRLKSAPPGYYYSVITNGFGVMYSYRARIKPEDRWRIIAYIRALQASQSVPARDLNAADLEALAESAREGT